MNDKIYTDFDDLSTSCLLCYNITSLLSQLSKACCKRKTNNIFDDRTHILNIIKNNPCYVK